MPSVAIYSLLRDWVLVVDGKKNKPTFILQFILLDSKAQRLSDLFVWHGHLDLHFRVHYHKLASVCFMLALLTASQVQYTTSIPMIFTSVSIRAQIQTLLCWNSTFPSPKSDISAHAFVWQIFLLIVSSQIPRGNRNNCQSKRKLWFCLIDCDGIHSYSKNLSHSVIFLLLIFCVMCCYFKNLQRISV